MAQRIGALHLGVLFAAAFSLFLVFAFAADVWARSSGRYGGRAGFSQSRSGSRGGGWSGPRPAPTRPYSAPTSPGYYPPLSSPGWGFLPFLLPFLGWGRGRWGRLRIRRHHWILDHPWDRRPRGPSVAYEISLQPVAIRLDGSPSASLGGDRYAVVKCQLALLSTARSLQRDLQTSANAATTDTVAGLGQPCRTS